MITFDHVSKTFASGVEAVCDLSIEIAEGETLVLLGSSGSGKTTTLKMINRLIEPTSGRIEVDECNVLELDPVELRRRIGYVFQGVGLFPHMTVLENAAIVPRLLGWQISKRQDRARDLLDLVGLPADEFAVGRSAAACRRGTGPCRRPRLSAHG